MSIPTVFKNRNIQFLMSQISKPLGSVQPTFKWSMQSFNRDPKVETKKRPNDFPESKKEPPRKKQKTEKKSRIQRFPTKPKFKGDALVPQVTDSLRGYVYHRFPDYKYWIPRWSKADQKKLEAKEPKIDKTGLATKGYTVTRRVISKEAISKAVDGAWETVELYENGPKRNDPSTHLNKFAPHNLHGLIQYSTGGHQPFVWELRQNADLLAFGADLHDCKIESLVCSFDAFNVSFPAPGEREASKNWSHMDQNGFKRRGRVSWQNQIPLTEQNSETGCTIVLEGSHKYFDEFFDEYLPKKLTKKGELNEYKKALGNEDWVKLEPADYNWFTKTKGCKMVFVEASPGDIVTWDSRTVHWACRPILLGNLENKSSRYVEAVGGPQTSQGPRMTVYICFEDRNMIPSKMRQACLARKQKIWEGRGVTSHNAYWPKVFQPSIRQYQGKTEAEIATNAEKNRKMANFCALLDARAKAVIATPVMKRLIGY